MHFSGDILKQRTWPGLGKNGYLYTQVALISLASPFPGTTQHARYLTKTNQGSL